jgi:hypothetical protein
MTTSINGKISNSRLSGEHTTHMEKRNELRLCGTRDIRTSMIES